MYLPHQENGTTPHPPHSDLSAESAVMDPLRYPVQVSSSIIREGSKIRGYVKGIMKEINEFCVCVARGFVEYCYCIPDVHLVLSEYIKNAFFIIKNKKIKNNPKSCFFFYIFLCTKHCYVLFFTFFMINCMKATPNCPSQTLCYCLYLGELEK